MAATFITQNGQTKAVLEFIGATIKIKKGFNAIAKKYWSRGFGDHGTLELPKVFTDLTDQEKLDTVFAYTLEMYRDDALDQLEKDIEESIKGVAEADYDDNVEINDV